MLHLIAGNLGLTRRERRKAA